MIDRVKTKTHHNKTNCLICANPLLYKNEAQLKSCFYCRREYETNTFCQEGHFVCDICHSANANEIIKSFCLTSPESYINPLQIANKIAKHHSIKMHGPEHHFLVPAVLLTAFYNASNQRHKLIKKIQQAEQRAKNVLGGFCGFYGTCGAAIGTGVFISLITDSTPLSTKTWKWSNLNTANVLEKIAHAGGPRCCKRDTFIAIENTVDFINEHFDVKLPKNETQICEFTSLNKECKRKGCKFYRT